MCPGLAVCLCNTWTGATPMLPEASTPDAVSALPREADVTVLPLPLAFCRPCDAAARQANPRGTEESKL